MTRLWPVAATKGVGALPPSRQHRPRAQARPRCHAGTLLERGWSALRGAIPWPAHACCSQQPATAGVGLHPAEPPRNRNWRLDAAPLKACTPRGVRLAPVPGAPPTRPCAAPARRLQGPDRTRRAGGLARTASMKAPASWAPQETTRFHRAFLKYGAEWDKVRRAGAAGTQLGEGANTCVHAQRAGRGGSHACWGLAAGCQHASALSPMRETLNPARRRGAAPGVQVGGGRQVARGVRSALQPAPRLPLAGPAVSVGGGVCGHGGGRHGPPAQGGWGVGVQVPLGGVK